jgi:hypothetical protein
VRQRVVIQEEIVRHESEPDVPHIVRRSTGTAASSDRIGREGFALLVDDLFVTVRNFRGWLSRITAACRTQAASQARIGCLGRGLRPFPAPIAVVARHGLDHPIPVSNRDFSRIDAHVVARLVSERLEDDR